MTVSTSGPEAPGPAESGTNVSGTNVSGPADPGAGSSLTADWAMPRGVIVVVGLGGLVATVAGMKAFSDVLAPTLFSLMLVMAVAPAQQWLKRWMPGWAAITTTLVLVYGTLLGFVLLLVISVARLATLAPQYAAEAEGLQQDLERQLERFGVGDEEFAQLIDNIDFNRLLGLFESILSSTLGLLSALVLIITLLFFMVVDASEFPSRAGAAARIRPDLVGALRRFVWGTQQYLIVSTIFGAIVAVLDTVALAIMGIPLAVLWGLLAFITNYIPNIGFVIGVVPPALLALLEGGVGLMVAVIIVYSALNMVIQTIIQPRFVGDAVGLSTTLTFISLIFWAWVLGPLGAILAVPMTLLAKALLVDLDPAAQWAIPFLGSGPPAATGDEAPFGPDITTPFDPTPDDPTPDDPAPAVEAPSGTTPGGREEGSS